MASGDWRPNPGESVVDHVAMSLGSEGLTVRDARRRALGALERVGVTATCGDEPAGTLSLAERTLVMLARALVHDPRVLLVDEPAVMPSLGDRNRFYVLLRELAGERNMALLVVSEEMGALQGAGRDDVDLRRRGVHDRRARDRRAAAKAQRRRRGAVRALSERHSSCARSSSTIPAAAGRSCGRSMASRSRSHRASSWRCTGRAARARPRCCCWRRR